MANPFDRFDPPSANPFDQFDTPATGKRQTMPNLAGPNFDYDPAWKPEAPAKGGLVASAKQAIGSTIKGAGQLAADFIPGVGQDNAVTRYGKSVVDANPTRVTDFDSLKENPLAAVTEATGNAAGSMGAMLGARALGQGITAVSPLAGPAAPLVAGLGQAVSWAGPAAVAALPSFGGIREKQIQKDPNAADSTADKLKAAVGAAAVGAIESRFGPQEWAMKAMTKEGRNALAEKFAANSLAGSVAKGATKGAAIEGAEELAQNPIEQIAAGDNPLTAENLKETAFGGAMGALGGGVLGGAGGAGFRKRPETAAQPTATPANQEMPPAPGENVALQQQILDEQEQLATSINPADGPLSSAASLAVQTGAAKTPTQIAIEQERQRAAELATQQDDADSEIYNSTGIEDQADNLDWMRLLAGEQTDLADLRDKAQFEAKQRQARQAGELRDAKDQMLAEGAYEADQRRAQQQAQQAADPGLPFERIAPEDYGKMPPGNRAAPALGFTPKAPDPMQATEDGLVGTAPQFDELSRANVATNDQMRSAAEQTPDPRSVPLDTPQRSQLQPLADYIAAGARIKGRDLVSPAGEVLVKSLNLSQAANIRRYLKESEDGVQDPAADAAMAPRGRLARLPLSIRDRKAAIDEAAELLGVDRNEVQSEFNARMRQHGPKHADTHLLTSLESLKEQRAARVQAPEVEEAAQPKAVALNPGGAPVRAKQLAEPQAASAPSELADIFADLASDSARRQNKARRKASKHAKAREIAYVEQNFLDILQQLEDSGRLGINCD